jgi:hypothetical protein
VIDPDYQKKVEFLQKGNGNTLADVEKLNACRPGKEVTQKDIDEMFNTTKTPLHYEKVAVNHDDGRD